MPTKDLLKPSNYMQIHFNNSYKKPTGIESCRFFLARAEDSKVLVELTLK